MHVERRTLRVDAGEVELDAEVSGPADGIPLLLISGLGSQRTEWPGELLAFLHEAGVRTLTFDNRDAGRSTLLDDRPGDAQDLRRWLDGQPFDVPYTLHDLARDALAVLDAVGVRDAHVLGRSMGGMVAQRLAMLAPERVRSLVSMMATTGAPDVGQPWPEALAAMAEPTPETRDEVIAAGVARARITNSPTLFDEPRVRARLEAAYDRSHRPAGTTRQLLAILADGDRTPLLGQLDVPTLVLHGAADTLIDVSGGRATAAAIPGARLVVVQEMGHDLPLPVLPEVAGEIVDHLRTVEAART